MSEGIKVTLGEVVLLFHVGGRGFNVGQELMEKMAKGALAALDRNELAELGIQSVVAKTFAFTPLDTEDGMLARIRQIRASGDSEQKETLGEEAGASGKPKKPRRK